MRVTFASVNRNVQRNLSRRYSDMVQLQEQLATGKRLHKPSDNPVDVANSVKLLTKQTQLSQYKRNIEDGLAIMGVASTAMGSMNELLHRARELAVQGSNGTYTERDRLYMQQEVDQLFRQMMSVINTQFKGNYIFNGTNTKVAPYTIASSGSELTDYNNRTMATYGKEFEENLMTGVINPNPGALSHTATDTIYLDFPESMLNSLKIGDKIQLMMNSNNPSLGQRPLNNIVPGTLDFFDTYEINSVDYERGTDYEINYKTGELSIITESFRDALNSQLRALPPADRKDAKIIDYNTFSANGTGGIQYSLTDTFQIVEGKFGDDITNIFPGSFTLNIGEKEYIEGFGEYKGGYYDEEGVYHKGENEFDFSVDYETGKITVYNMELMKDMRPGWLYDLNNNNYPNPDLNPPLVINSNDPYVYRHGQLALNFDYITRGTDIYGDKVTSQGDIFRAIEEGISSTINIGADNMLRDRPSGNDMVGVFLRYSQALLKDDRDGIQNALDELTTMYDAVLNSQSKMGAQIYRFELTLSRNSEQNVEVTAQASSLIDADLAEVISKLMLAENVYQAALQAAMRVIQPSLANYM